MDRRTIPTSAPQHCMLGVEPLEDRWLLSGVALLTGTLIDAPPPVADGASSFQAAAAAVTTESPAALRAVEVVEFGAADTNDDATAVPIAPSQLPMTIRAAIDAHFPGAELIEAEQNDDEGTPVFDVTAEFRGRLIAVTLAPDGEIIETELSVNLDELPQPVLDWVRTNFPGAMIDEANRVTGAGAVSYGVRIAVSEQQQFEATLRVEDTEPPSASVRSNEVGERFGPLPTIVHGTASLADQRLLGDTAHRKESPESATRANAESSDAAIQPPAPRATTHDEPESQPADSSRAVEAGDPVAAEPPSVADARSAFDTRGRPTTPLAEAVRVVAEIAVNSAARAWLPQVSGTLGDVLPIDVAAVEQSLKELLAEIDALAEKVAGDTPVSRTALRVVVIAGLVTGAELVILESKKPRRESVIETNAASSSWSWILGATTKRS